MRFQCLVEISDSSTKKILCHIKNNNCKSR